MVFPSSKDMNMQTLLHIAVMYGICSLLETGMGILSRNKIEYSICSAETMNKHIIYCHASINNNDRNKQMIPCQVS